MQVNKGVGVKISLIFLFLILLFCGIYIFLKTHIEHELISDKFYDGIIIEGVNVSGKSKNEAIQLVYKKLKKEQEDMVITVYCEDKNAAIHGKNLKFEFKVEDAVNLAYTYARDGSLFSRYVSYLQVKNDENRFAVEGIIDEENLAQNANLLAYKFDDLTLEAHVKAFNPNDERMFVYEEGRDGYKLDKNEVAQQLKKQALTRKSGAIYLEKHEYKNETTIADVQNKTQLIGEFKTISTNGDNSNQNMKIALNAVNGTIINPGEIFSFNAIVGDSNDSSKGFLPGASILNGEVVRSYGGGVCQAATTIYGAAIRTDMTIIERKNHCLMSSYVPYGLDAAIYYNNIDLKFRNDLFYPVYIKADMVDKELKCQIFGPKSEKFDTIEVNSWADDCSDVIKAEAERIYYKNQKIVNKKRLPSSVYRAKPLPHA